MRMFSRRLLAVYFCSCIAAALTGCGDLSTHPAGGTVRYSDGATLPDAIVEFRCQTLQGTYVNASGVVKDDGTFRLSTFSTADGAIAGTHQAVVIPPPDVAPSNMSGPPPKPPLAFKFSQYGESGFKFLVTPDGPNDFELVIEHPSKRNP